MADTQSAPASVDSPADYGSTPEGIHARWLAEIKLGLKETEKYRERCKKIRRRYRGDDVITVAGENREVPQGLQILWSTVQTQIPAVYQFPPDVEVSRRFRTKDPIARVAALMLERYLDVEKDRDDLSAEILSVLQDRLLCSLGQMWIEYEPVVLAVPQPVALTPGEDGKYTTGAGQEYTGEPPQMAPDGSYSGMQPMEQIVDCRAPAIHLHIEDFLHSPARTWREVRWVARRQFFTRDECLKQFARGQAQFKWDVNALPLTVKAKGTDDDEENVKNLFKRVEVWQIWDDRKVYYIAKAMQVPLQVDDRPLALKSAKWPCPRPYYGTMTSDSLIPIPDFTQWQELADEIDELSARIESLTRAVKLVGARSQSMAELDKILLQDTDNMLVPVENWAMFLKDGGLEKGIAWLPMEQVMAVLVQLQQQRRERIDYCYQINGIGDILRGQGDPRSTATAEEIKEDYGSLRLRQMQQDLGSFIERVLQIKGEVICEKAPPNVIAEIAGANEFPEADRRYIQPALQMLKDQRVRDLRIDVDERSMVAMQDQKEKTARMEYIQGVTPMIGQVVQAMSAAPAVLDVAAEALLFASRGFRVGRDMEGTLEQFTDSMRQFAAQARQAQQGKPPPEPPEIAKERLRHDNTMAEQVQDNTFKLGQITAEANATRDREAAQARSESAINEMKAAAEARLNDQEARNDAMLARLEAMLEIRLKEIEAQHQARAAERDRQFETLQKRVTGKRKRKVVYNENGDPDHMIDEYIGETGDDGDQGADVPMMQ